MADRYQFAAGHNNEGSLVNVSPQPRTPGILYPESLYAVSNRVYEDGKPSTSFQYSNFILYEEYANALSIFGLTSAKSAPGTFHLRKNDDSWANFNGTIVRPNVGDGLERGTGWWRTAKFDIIGLVEL